MTDRKNALFFYQVLQDVANHISSHELDDPNANETGPAAKGMVVCQPTTSRPPPSPPTQDFSGNVGLVYRDQVAPVEQTNIPREEPSPPKATCDSANTLPASTSTSALPNPEDPPTQVRHASARPHPEDLPTRVTRARLCSSVTRRTANTSCLALPIPKMTRVTRSRLNSPVLTAHPSRPVTRSSQSQKNPNPTHTK